MVAKTKMNHAVMTYLPKLFYHISLHNLNNRIVLNISMPYILSRLSYCASYTWRLIVENITQLQQQ